MGYMAIRFLAFGWQQHSESAVIWGAACCLLLAAAIGGTLLRRLSVTICGAVLLIFVSLAGILLYAPMGILTGGAYIWLAVRQRTPLASALGARAGPGTDRSRTLG